MFIQDGQGTDNGRTPDARNGTTSRVIRKIRRNHQVLRVCFRRMVSLVGAFFYHASLHDSVLRENQGRVVELRI